MNKFLNNYFQLKKIGFHVYKYGGCLHNSIIDGSVFVSMESVLQKSWMEAYRWKGRNNSWIDELRSSW